jgi:glycosyltransferase involved in cell wall biosynthesis
MNSDLRVLVVSGPPLLEGDGLWAEVSRRTRLHFAYPSKRPTLNRIPLDVALPHGFHGTSSAHRPVGPLERGHANIWYCGLGRTIYRFKPDVIHVLAEPWAVPTQQALAIARGRTPVVCHGAEALYGFPGLRGLLRRAALWNSRRRLSGFVGWSCPTLQAFLGDGSPALTVLELPGELPDPAFFRPSVPENADMRADRPFTLAFVGRLSPEKGPDLAIQVAARSGCRLVVAGEGPMESALREQASQAGVTFVGSLQRAEIARLFETVDALVVPSRRTSVSQEQFGRVVVEAALAGVPSLVSDVGALPRTSGQPELVFQAEDAEALAQLVLRLANAPEELAELKFRARRDALARWAPATAAEALISFWSGVLA